MPLPANSKGVSFVDYSSFLATKKNQTLKLSPEPHFCPHSSAIEVPISLIIQDPDLLKVSSGDDQREKGALFLKYFKKAKK